MLYLEHVYQFDSRILHVCPGPGGSACLCLDTGHQKLIQLDLATGQQSVYGGQSNCTKLLALTNNSWIWREGENVVSKSISGDTLWRVGVQTFSRVKPDAVRDQMLIWTLGSDEVTVYSLKTGQLLAVYHAPLDGIYGLSVDRSGGIWASFAALNFIARVNIDGTVTHQINGWVDGEEEYSPGTIFNHPGSIDIDFHGNIWVFNQDRLGIDITVIWPDGSSYVRLVNEPELSDCLNENLMVLPSSGRLLRTIGEMVGVLSFGSDSGDQAKPHS